MFKGYNKTDTSGRNMLRIEKRERVLGLAIIAASLVKEPEIAPGMTRMQLASTSNHDLIDWEVQLIKETGWLQEPEIMDLCNGRWVTYRDTRKIRIYRKWLFHNERKTLKQVLKYMYSPLFVSLLLMHRGEWEGTALHVDLYYNDNSIDMLSQWFKDLFDISCHRDVNSWNSDVLVFENEDLKKLLTVCEPIVKQIPSMYEKFYRNKAAIIHGEYDCEKTKIIS
jgi:hypothetical protein